MYRQVEVTGLKERERFCSFSGISTLNPEIVARQRPDALWMLMDAEDLLAARCSLWWNNPPPLGEHRPGIIGHVAVREARALPMLLEMASAQLAARGCTLAVGPMDGNTWNRYRLVTGRGTEPAFFLEPDNPDDWPGHFTGAGFTPLAQYYSALNPDLSQEDPKTGEIARRVEQLGISLRPLLLDRFEDELRRIHALSLESFRDNFLYTPIGEEDFVAQYRGVLRFVRPEMILLAEQGKRLVGFIFGIPDLLQTQRSPAIDTAIVKTMAVHPDHAGAGLGGLLMARCHEAMRRLGYRRAIHALMHEANRSGRISRHTARVIRRYTLFARELEAYPIRGQTL